MPSDDIIPVLAHALESNATILAACYSHITPGYPATLQDSKLTSSEPTAIWLRDLDMTESGYVGSATSYDYQYDILFQVDVMSVTSQAVAESLRRLISNLLKSTTTKTFNGSIYIFDIHMQSRPASRYDDVLMAWVAPLRMRAIGNYSAN